LVAEYVGGRGKMKNEKWNVKLKVFGEIGEIGEPVRRGRV